MRFIPLVMLFLFFSAHLAAQNDSLGYFDVYKNEVQQTLNPALVSDMGKHIVRGDVQWRRSTFDNNEHPLFYWQTSYSTQWRRHGFGIKSQNIPSSQLIYSNTIGLQYAYGFGLGKNTFWKNTKLNMGVGLNVTRYKSNFDAYTFNDQMDDNQGVVRPTSEAHVNTSILMPTIDAGLSIRSRKFYLTSGFYNIAGSTTGFYQSTGSFEGVNIHIQTGAKLFEYKGFSSWLTFEELFSETTDWYAKIGLSAAYKHIIVTYKTISYDAQSLQVSYVHPRLRLYVQYQNTPNEFTSYINYGIFSTGIALGITKQ